MKLPLLELIGVALMSLAMASTQNLISPGTESGERITGDWTSYTPTRFGATSVKFVANGRCEFRIGADETYPCKWQETGTGQTTIMAFVSGRTETFFASVSGDTMVVREPGRETSYVRVNSREAYERQRLARGPG